MDKSIRHTGHVKEAIKSRNRDEGQYSLPYEIMVCVTHKSLSLSLRVETIGIYSLVDLGAIQHFKGTVSKSMLSYASYPQSTVRETRCIFQMHKIPSCQSHSTSTLLGKDLIHKHYRTMHKAHSKCSLTSDMNTFDKLNVCLLDCKT